MTSRSPKSHHRSKSSEELPPSADLPLKCRCGRVRGAVENVASARGARMVCFCDDCQAYAHWLGRASELLDGNGGTDICPVEPARLTISRGAEHLKCVRLSDAGMFRWYAGCCKTPIANVPTSKKMPYAGLVVVSVDQSALQEGLDDKIGPIQARMQARFATGSPPSGSLSTISVGVMISVLGFLLKSWWHGGGRTSPFIKDGRPLVKPNVLSFEDRESLRKFCGPNPAP